MLTDRHSIKQSDRQPETDRHRYIVKQSIRLDSPVLSEDEFLFIVSSLYQTQQQNPVCNMWTLLSARLRSSPLGIGVAAAVESTHTTLHNSLNRTEGIPVPQTASSHAEQGRVAKKLWSMRCRLSDASHRRRFIHTITLQFYIQYFFLRFEITLEVKQFMYKPLVMWDPFRIYSQRGTSYL